MKSLGAGTSKILGTLKSVLIFGGFRGLAIAGLPSALEK